MSSDCINISFGPPWGTPMRGVIQILTIFSHDQFEFLSILQVPSTLFDKQSSRTNTKYGAFAFPVSVGVVMTVTSVWFEYTCNCMSAPSSMAVKRASRGKAGGNQQR